MMCECINDLCWGGSLQSSISGRCVRPSSLVWATFSGADLSRMAFLSRSMWRSKSFISRCTWTAWHQWENSWMLHYFCSSLKIDIVFFLWVYLFTSTSIEFSHLSSPCLGVQGVCSWCHCSRPVCVLVPCWRKTMLSTYLGVWLLSGCLPLAVTSESCSAHSDSAECCDWCALPRSLGHSLCKTNHTSDDIWSVIKSTPQKNHIPSQIVYNHVLYILYIILR